MGVCCNTHVCVCVRGCVCVMSVSDSLVAIVAFGCSALLAGACIRAAKHVEQVAAVDTPVVAPPVPPHDMACVCVSRTAMHWCTRLLRLHHHDQVGALTLFDPTHALQTVCMCTCQGGQMHTPPCAHIYKKKHTLPQFAVGEAGIQHHRREQRHQPNTMDAATNTPNTPTNTPTNTPPWAPGGAERKGALFQHGQGRCRQNLSSGFDAVAGTPARAKATVKDPARTTHFGQIAEQH